MSQPPIDTSSPIVGRWDTVIIGGGPAGLAAAIQLARLGRSCVVVDDDAGRSLWSQVTRNHLGFPDGIKAADLRLLGQRQAVRYGATLRSGRVAGLQRDLKGGFRVRIEPPGPADPAEASDEPGAVDPEDSQGLSEHRRRERDHGARLGERRTRSGTWTRARTVLLATGVVDAFPAFEGRDACVGVSLFWCIVCDGYEARGRSVVVVGDDPEGLSTAFGLVGLGASVTLVTGRRRARASRVRLRALGDRGVAVHRAAVAEYRHEDGRIESVRLADEGATDLACTMVFVSSPRRPRSELGRRLRAGTDGAGYLVVDDDGRTSVARLYAAGDVTAGHAHQVSAAAYLGATAATAVNHDLSEPVERGE
ncbi:MAG: NAD(P)/FAD-dependent oxidoreductase [Chloroflexi bacterium]|nr:NAD(P)/FAD-dependent oxidoreductase [Chloroflexota bacterium]